MRLDDQKPTLPIKRHTNRCNNLRIGGDELQLVAVVDDTWFGSRESASGRHSNRDDEQEAVMS
jgi:hypothetical protein